MAIWFVSRHQGAIEWIKRQEIHIDFWKDHLIEEDFNSMTAQDIVLGTLPIHLAARVCDIGAKFYFLSIDISPDKRGKELDSLELTTANAQLVRYIIKKEDTYEY